MSSPPILNTGHREDPFDGRDRYYIPQQRIVPSTMKMPFSLRAHKDYRNYFRAVYNQSYTPSQFPEAWGTCVANACAAAFSYEWARQGLGLQRDPSRLYIYWNARTIGGNNANSTNKDVQGTQTRYAMNVLSRGVPWEADLPYDDAHFAKEPDANAKTNATHNRAFEYCRLDPDNPEEVNAWLSNDERDTIGRMTLLRLRQCLAEGYPVVFAFEGYKEDARDCFERAEDQVWRLKPLPPANERTRQFGHAVLAIGFDDRPGYERILCQNSWGELYTFFYVGYEWIKDFVATTDFWMIRQVQQDTNSGTWPVYVADVLARDSTPANRSHSVGVAGFVNPQYNKPPPLADGPSSADSEETVTIAFSPDYQKPPMIPLGVTAIDMSKHNNYRFEASASGIAEDQFTLTMRALPGTTLYSARVAWPEIEQDDPDIQVGRYVFKSPTRTAAPDNAGGRQFAWKPAESFPRKFSAKPKFHHWISGFDMPQVSDSSFGVWLHTAFYLLEDGSAFWPNILTCDYNWNSVTVDWIAYPEGKKGIASGVVLLESKFLPGSKYRTFPPKRADFPAGTFGRPPKVFVGMEGLNFFKEGDFKFSLIAEDVTSAGFTMNCTTWGDADPSWARASWIAFG